MEVRADRVARLTRGGIHATPTFLRVVPGDKIGLGPSETRAIYRGDIHASAKHRPWKIISLYVTARMPSRGEGHGGRRGEGRRKRRRVKCKRDARSRMCVRAWIVSFSSLHGFSRCADEQGHCVEKRT